MIRVLAMIAIAGFILSVASFAAAVAIAGPGALSRGAWPTVSRYWVSEWGGHGDRDSGPSATRTLPWSGAQRLDVNVPADVRYVQADGPATVTVTGPRRLIDQIVVDGDTIGLGERSAHWRQRKLSIIVRAPNISVFGLTGRNELRLEGYHQPKLELDISGAADVVGEGETDSIEVEISGVGDVDLGKMKTKGAAVGIAGAGEAVIAPTERAELNISGAGEIRLLTHPARLQTSVSGAGSIRQNDAGEAPAAPAPKKTTT
jgi:hypothetical protein